jgi:hypothetical protein
LFRLRARALEGDLAVADECLDAIELAQKIGLPGLTTVFPVGDRFQPDRLLFGDQRFDLAIFDLGERRSFDFAALVSGPRVLQRRRAKQAAHMVSPKGRPNTLHRNG